MSAKIMRCDCEHDYQDAKHGQGMRVHNKMKSAPKEPDRFNCSVCAKGMSQPHLAKRGLK